MEQIQHSLDGTQAIKIFHYASPLLVASYYILSNVVAFCRLRPGQNHGLRRGHRTTALGLMALITLSYMVETALFIIRSLVQDGWWIAQDRAIFAMGSLFVWLSLLIAFLDSSSPRLSSYCGAAILGGSLETICSTITLGLPDVEWYAHALIAVEIVRVLTLFAFASFLSWVILKFVDNGAKDEESQPLLETATNGHASPQDTQYQYGAISESSDSEDDSDEEAKLKKQQQKRIEEEGGWIGYLKSFSVFLPYMWPSKNRKIQLFIASMIPILAAERALNLLIPRQLGIITNNLANSEGLGRMPWREVSIWVALQFVGSGAVLGALQDFISWQIQQFSYKELTMAGFRHVMNLSMDFHYEKNSGEILRAIQQGHSLSSLVEEVLFSQSPVVIDLFIALAYVTHLFDFYFAFTVMVVGLAFVWVSIKFIAWKTPMRRRYTEKSRNEYKVMTESVHNWQTVAYFNHVDYECGRTSRALNGLVSEWGKLFVFGRIEYTIETLVMMTGLLVISLLGAYRISQGFRPVGSFVTLVTYWATLSGPLRTMAYSYRRITSDLVDAERLLQLLRTKPTVADSDDAEKLHVWQGNVDFAGVSFLYDPRKATLQDIHFTAEPGKTVALVGETGAGKSTILKLLFRFYDVSEGSITIDGKDIRNVTLASLREAMGVVPQDPSLFNVSILENVRYGRLDASDEEVYEACKGASIHEKIMSFPDRYKSKVGERGVKLSGGELQRIAIARVLLKNPRIVLLDEATSAVDSSTEATIQEAFKKLSEGRTTLVIAHRLSTIMDADLILVIDNGKIIERGTHSELLRIKGQYAHLWEKQTSKTGLEQVEEDLLLTVGDSGASTSAQVPTPAEGTDNLSLLDELNEQEEKKTGKRSKDPSSEGKSN